MRYGVIIPIEGVLSGDDNLRSGSVTDWGRRLYESLRSEYRIILFTASDDELARVWLTNNFMGDFASLMTADSSWRTYEDWRIDTVRQMLADGAELSMMVDMDPEVLRQVSNMGLLTMLLIPPAQRRGWRHHQEEARPWSEVAGSVRNGGSV